MPDHLASSGEDHAVRVSFPNCVKLLDATGAILSLNEDGLQVLEIDDIASVRGQHWSTLWPEQARPLVEDALEGARTGGVATFVGERPTAKGTLKWWDVTVASLPAPAGHFCVISRDITERRRSDLRAAASDARLKMALTGSGAVGLWDWMVDTDLVHGDANFARLYGLDAEKAATGLTEADYQTFVVPEDLPPLRAKIRAVFERGADFLVEYRLAVPGQPLRWVECKGKMIEGSGGESARFSGTAVDITSRKLAEQQKQLLMEELSHRVKNTFAVIQAIARQTLRGIDRDVFKVFQGRLTALSQAHDLLLQSNWIAAPFTEVIGRVLRLEAEGDRFELAGKDFNISSDAALSLSLLLHEMATNAFKYGALSAEDGKVRIEWQIDEPNFRLSWIEIGGPPAKPPVRDGFGSRLIEMGIGGSGQVDLRYTDEGLRATFGAPLLLLRK